MSGVLSPVFLVFQAVLKTHTERETPFSQGISSLIACVRTPRLKEDRGRRYKVKEEGEMVLVGVRTCAHAHTRARAHVRHLSLKEISEIYLIPTLCVVNIGDRDLKHCEMPGPEPG